MCLYVQHSGTLTSLKDFLKDFFNIKTNVTEKNAKFALTLKNNMILLLMTQTSQGSYTPAWRRLAVQGHDLRPSSQRSLHFLQWVINQMWHGPSLWNRGVGQGKRTGPGPTANHTVSTRPYPEPCLHILPFWLVSYLGADSSKIISPSVLRKDTPISRKSAVSKLFSLLPFYPPATSGVTLQSHILRCELEVTVSTHLFCYCALLNPDLGAPLSTGWPGLGTRSPAFAF